MRITIYEMSLVRSAKLIILSVVTWICQGITVEPFDGVAAAPVYSTVPYYRSSTPLPPQLAYYVRGGGSLSEQSTPKIVNKKKLPINNEAASSQIYNSGVINVLEPPVSKYSLNQVHYSDNKGYTPYHSSNIFYQLNNGKPYSHYGKPSSHYGQSTISNYGPPPSNYVNYQLPNNNKLHYQAAPQNYGFVTNYKFSGNDAFSNANAIVRATPPPQRKGRPPPPQPKYPFQTTYQVDQKTRNYQMQQEADRQRGPKLTPHYQSQAIFEVQAPKLGPPYDENSAQIHPALRQQIGRLREHHREHFQIDQDEHPAQPGYINQDAIDQSDPNFDVYNNGIGIFRAQENNYNTLKGQFENFKLLKQEPPSYDRYKKEFLNSDRQNQNSHYTSLRPSFDVYQSEPDSNQKYHYNQPLKHHTDPGTDQGYENYESAAQYNFKGPLRNEFKTFLKKSPKFVQPTLYDNSIGPTPENTYGVRKKNFVPFKMLSSVRHSESVSHHTRHDDDDPDVKERLLEEGAHIVYTEEGYEDDQYDHGDEERFANFQKGNKSRKISRRPKRSVSRTFPYYFAPVNDVPEISAVRYIDSRGGKARTAKRFYDTKTKNCDAVELDDTLINDKNNDIETKKRLIGLGDTLDCIRTQLFGSNPFDNPLFREEFVSDQMIKRTIRPKRQKTDTNAAESKLHTHIYIPSPTTTTTTTTTTTLKPPTTTTPKTLLIKTLGPIISSYVAASSANATEKAPLVNKIPTIILLNNKTLEKVRSNPNIPLGDILKYPEIQNSEIFIFDISKFIPRLFMTKELNYLRDPGAMVSFQSYNAKRDKPITLGKLRENEATEKISTLPGPKKKENSKN